MSRLIVQLGAWKYYNIPKILRVEETYGNRVVLRLGDSDSFEIELDSLVILGKMAEGRLAVRKLEAN